MNLATANLEEDHVHIVLLTDVMEKMTTLPTANSFHLDEVVTIIKQFADGIHHAKEENLLFPKMVEKGFSFQQGPITVMMNDHEQGRTFVRNMTEHILKYKAGNPEALPEVYKNMLNYTGLLRAHIAKENNILFRMADNVLTPEEQQLLFGEFKQIGGSSSAGIGASDFIHRILILAKAYNIR
ncbi:MAG: hemerythrin domain-containing protein [Salinivirgaceae bacterium]|nr:hemerythrin domain-containing protein [Salinivirgaceae bacterium]